MQTPVAIGEVIDGKYRVDRILATGGMGVVVLAWHLELAQEVAIKFLHGLGADADLASQRLRREARAAARIRSQHVARVFDVGALRGDVPYMVMEFLEGNDLADELGSRRRLPLQEAVYYVLQAIEALAEAHAAGIVHCDLKPENIFLAVRADGTRSVKVLDFGISKWLVAGSSSDSLNRSLLFGSPPYMSPEQMRSNESIDHRADVWSLGAILYEAVTGRAPHVGESLAEVCTAVLEGVPLPMTELYEEGPEGFEIAVLRCLEKNPNQRYQDVAELAEALVEFAPGCSIYAERARRVLSGVPLSGRPTPLPADPSSSLLLASRDLTTAPVSVPKNDPLPVVVLEELSSPTPPPARATAASRRPWGIWAAVLCGALFGVAAWTVSSARGALEPQAREAGRPQAASESTLSVTRTVSAARGPEPEPVPMPRAPMAEPQTSQDKPEAHAAPKATLRGSRIGAAPKRPFPFRPAPPAAKAPSAQAPSAAEPAPQNPKPVDPSGVTDFGGRR